MSTIRKRKSIRQQRIALARAFDQYIRAERDRLLREGRLLEISTPFGKISIMRHNLTNLGK